MSLGHFRRLPGLVPPMAILHNQCYSPKNFGSINSILAPFANSSNRQSLKKISSTIAIVLTMLELIFFND